MTAPTMRTVTLPDGSAAPALGMGTWYLGEDPDSTRAHVIENRAALEIGFSQAELDQLDRIFPPPFGKVPLDVL
jgi:diketogulonate reductase-like aldo/keto reductase